MLSLLVTTLFAVSFGASLAAIAGTFHRYHAKWAALAAAHADTASHHALTVAARPARPFGPVVYARQFNPSLSAPPLQSARRAAA